MNDRLVYRMPDLVKAVGLSKTTIYRMMRAGKFPRPIALSEDMVGWRPDEVKAWVDARPVVAEE